MSETEDGADREARRAALVAAATSGTGLDEAVIETLVRTFYARARVDPLIGPAFAGVHDWEAHIARIRAFWSSVLFMSGRYRGNPMAAHLKLPIAAPHFARWLALFEQTAREVCTPEGAGFVMERARRIARSLEMGLEVQRGVLPGAAGPARSVTPRPAPPFPRE